MFKLQNEASERSGTKKKVFCDRIKRNYINGGSRSGRHWSIKWGTVMNQAFKVFEMVCGWVVMTKILNVPKI